MLKIQTGGRLSSWLFTKREGVESGTTKHKSIRGQGGRFERGTSELQLLHALLIANWSVSHQLGFLEVSVQFTIFVYSFQCPQLVQ